ncbi:UDP-4-amino-4,6-dideoxy-N-acetyl-beta-L-altrosamine transaminase [Candidatus Aerophobetes bacterium]|uniref:UDP-4-amino-4, 6-dideoxy-N-acetyl-beta-L-altrosamine transaminase n=1 Tax=Aerophobetes bacterium TaxID=2030807 RepID=A0A662DKI2_UNCAE|nr:MAG: UDP-4-amino-4,6-dideoxy-N-acetyl-beta-L-altrosamine transaminase [Candidatus Aerophobetes bacterium]
MQKRIVFLPYGHQWIDEEDIKEVTEVLKSEWMTQGPKVKEFERKLANYCGANYAVVFSSGTAALHGAYFAGGIKEGCEIITSPITFLSTTNAALFLYAHPVFVDVEKDTGNINPGLIEKKVTEKTKVIAPVHYGGHPADLEKISKVAKKYNLLVIEDACHALGAEYKGEKIGSCKYSDMTVFSFHPVKSITTGEGGAVLTNNKEYYKKLIMFREHGVTKDQVEFKKLPPGDWYYEMHLLGYNYRLTDIQCALGASQLKKLNKFIQRRREIAKIYGDAFRDNDFFELPEEKSYAKSSWHLYPVKLKDMYKDKKREIFAKLREEGLGVQVHYIPVYLQPYYQRLGYRKGICPNAEDFYQREISIPLYQSMSGEDIEYVVNTIFKVFKEV